MSRSPLGPSIRKVQRAPRIRSLTRRWVCCEPGWVQSLFEHADILSEGAFRGTTYYGTTSIALQLTPSNGARTSPQAPAENDLEMQLLRCDPHARLLALRIARREALVRAATPLDTLFSELIFDSHPGALIIRVELEAERADASVEHPRAVR